MIFLIGVGHVFEISEQINSIISGVRPEAVCVELDPARYQALLHKKSKEEVHLAYRVLAFFQRRIAKRFGGEVGEEMLAAVEAARSVGADVLFIDIEASSMFSRLWDQMPLKEKVMLMMSAVWSLFVSREKMEEEIERFQKNEGEYMGKFSRQFPTLKQILIDDRNETMAYRIETAEEEYGSVVAVVGDGHVEGISRLLEGRELQVTRLKELREMEPGEAVEEFSSTEGNTQVTIQFEYKQD